MQKRETHTSSASGRKRLVFFLLCCRNLYVCFVISIRFEEKVYLAQNHSSRYNSGGVSDYRSEGSKFDPGCGPNFFAVFWINRCFVNMYLNNSSFTMCFTTIKTWFCTIALFLSIYFPRWLASGVCQLFVSQKSYIILLCIKCFMKEVRTVSWPMCRIKFKLLSPT